MADTQQAGGNGGAAVVIVAIMVLLFATVLFFMYALPALQNVSQGEVKEIKVEIPVPGIDNSDQEPAP